MYKSGYIVSLGIHIGLLIVIGLLVYFDSYKKIDNNAITINFQQILAKQIPITKSIKKIESKSSLSKLALKDTVSSDDVQSNSNDVVVFSNNQLQSIYNDNKLPQYPKIAVFHNWQGKVLLKVIISKNGDVLKAEINESSGYSILDNSALSTIINWKVQHSNNYDITAIIPIVFAIK